MLAAPDLSRDLASLVGAALDGSDNAVAVFRRFSEGLVYTSGNTAFSRLTAWAPPAARGMSLLRLLGQADDSLDRGRLLESIASGQGLRTEIACRSQTGRSFWFDFSLMPAADDHFVLLGQDITERKLAAQQEQAIQGLLAKVFGAIDAAVGIIGTDGRLLMANPALHTLLEQLPGTLIGAVALDHVEPATRAAVEAAWVRQNTEAQPCHVSLRLLRGAGKPIDAHLHSALMVRQDQQRFRILTLNHDPEPARLSDPRRFLVAGKIRLVGLRDVREALGSRWADMAERAMQMAEHVARKRLGPSDSFARTDDHGLMISFGGLTEDEASFRAAMVGREIHDRLIGMDHDPATAQVTAIVAAMEVPECGLDSAALPRILDERLGARRAEIETRARDTLRVAMRETHCELDVVQQRDGKPVAHYARLPAVAERRIAAAACSLPPEELGDFDLDALRLQLGVEREAEVALEGAGLPLFVDIGFSVFDTRGRAKRLLDACVRLPMPVREQLTIIITERPADLHDARLRDCLQRLRPFCRDIGFGTDHLELPPVGAPTGAGPPTMVVAASALLSGGELREELLFQFIPQLRVRGVRLLVRDVPSPGMARDLREMGVDLIAMRAPEDPIAG